MYGVRTLFIGMESKSLGKLQFFLASEMKMFIDLQKDENSMFIEQSKPGSIYTFDMGMMYKIKDMKCNSFMNSVLYNENIILDNIRDTLIAAVRKRVDNTDRPIACLLSGGLDSSLITGLVSNILGLSLIHI